jgi:hypothetical protein
MFYITFKLCNLKHQYIKYVTQWFGRFRTAWSLKYSPKIPWILRYLEFFLGMKFDSIIKQTWTLTLWWLPNAYLTVLGNELGLLHWLATSTYLLELIVVMLTLVSDQYLPAWADCSPAELTLVSVAILSELDADVTCGCWEDASVPASANEITAYKIHVTNQWASIYQWNHSL